MNDKSKSSEVQMLIRKGPLEVYNAFVDPNITKEFWFTHGSANLEVGKEVIWTWEMYNFSAKAVAVELIPGEKISFDWFDSDKSTRVTIGFVEQKSGATYVSIVHNGFDQMGDDLIQAIKDSTNGFTLVLAGLKAYLEHGINLNLVLDRFPKE